MQRKRLVFIYKYLAIAISLVICAGCAAHWPNFSGADLTATQPVAVQADSTIPATTYEFFLGVGDAIDIEVYRHTDLNKSLQIEESGKINYPLIGDVTAAGLTAIQLRNNIQAALAKYLVDPQVMVSVKGMHSQKVYVLGEVAKPGVFTMVTPMNIFEAISQAGGFTLDAKNESVMVIRGDRTKPQLLQLDLASVLSKGNISQDIQIRGGDIVYIPPTYIADVSRFSVYLKNILSPILMVEQGVILGNQIAGIIEGTSNSQQTTIVVHP